MIDGEKRRGSSRSVFVCHVAAPARIPAAGADGGPFPTSISECRPPRLRNFCTIRADAASALTIAARTSVAPARLAASGPCDAAVSARFALRVSPSGRGSRASASDGDCSAGTCASSATVPFREFRAGAALCQLQKRAADTSSADAHSHHTIPGKSNQ